MSGQELYDASEKGDSKKVKELIDKGADVNYKGAVWYFSQCLTAVKYILHSHDSLLDLNYKMNTIKYPYPLSQNYTLMNNHYVTDCVIDSCDIDRDS